MLTAPQKAKCVDAQYLSKIIKSQKIMLLPCEKIRSTKLPKERAGEGAEECVPADMMMRMKSFRRKSLPLGFLFYILTSFCQNIGDSVEV